MDLNNLSSNWKKLQASGKLKKGNSESFAQISTLPVPKSTKVNNNLKRKREAFSTSFEQDTTERAKTDPRKMLEKELAAQTFVTQIDGQDEPATDSIQSTSSDRINEGLARGVDVGKYLAIDCEMVGVGPHPHLESALARVSVVNYNGEQVYDSYVKPQEEVTDWRTHVSGIQPKHMVHARALEEVQSDVASLLKNRVVVGHSVRGDFEALFLDHPKRDIRDTARHPPYRKLNGGGSPKLKILVSELLGLDIQVGEHSSIEDARATMLLFRRDKDSFEREHMKTWGPPVVTKKNEERAQNPDVNKSTKKRKKKKKR